MNENRGAWYLLTGAVIGLIAGILISLMVVPVKYVNTDPASLRAEDQQKYRALVAEAYLAEGDLGRARSRLALLGDPDQAEPLVAEAQNILAEGGSDNQARALALLAAAINEPSMLVTPLPLAVELAVRPTEYVPAGTQTVGPTRTPGPTGTPRPTSTPLPTQGPPFVKIQEFPVCDPLPEEPLLQVIVLDAAGNPVPGVKIEISQSVGGIETFYTGLYPEISAGYADYTMEPGVNYAIRVGESGLTTSDLTAPSCGEGDDGKTWGSLKVVFQQP